MSAPAPQRVIDNGKYGPGFHANVAVSKCADSIPLHRQAKQFERSGVRMNRSTLGDVFHRTAELTSPIARRIMEKIAQSEHINADETPLQVMKEPGRSNTSKSYMWVYVGGDPDRGQSD